MEDILQKIYRGLGAVTVRELSNGLGISVDAALRGGRGPVITYVTPRHRVVYLDDARQWLAEMRETSDMARRRNIDAQQGRMVA